MDEKKTILLTEEQYLKLIELKDKKLEETFKFEIDQINEWLEKLDLGGMIVAEENLCENLANFRIYPQFRALRRDVYRARIYTKDQAIQQIINILSHQIDYFRKQYTTYREVYNTLLNMTSREFRKWKKVNS